MAVLALRAHYTMDIFTGVVTALYASYISGCITDWLDNRKLQYLK